MTKPVAATRGVNGSLSAEKPRHVERANAPAAVDPLSHRRVAIEIAERAADLAAASEVTAVDVAELRWWVDALSAWVSEP